MGYTKFDEFASTYDQWFIDNNIVFETELKLVAASLKDSGEILSVGCGSGLFERSLRDDYGMNFTRCIEPSASMAAIAEKRGFSVEVAEGEMADYGEEMFDTVLFNGCPCYMNDMVKAFSKAYRALRPGGKIVVIDVPKESAYGLLYNLALAVGTWDHPLLEGVKPQMPYPIEFVKEAQGRPIAEIAGAMRDAGFTTFNYLQSLTAHPLYSHITPEEPIEGYDRGSYVAIIGTK